VLFTSLVQIHSLHSWSTGSVRGSLPFRTTVLHPTATQRLNGGPLFTYTALFTSLFFYLFVLKMWASRLRSRSQKSSQYLPVVASPSPPSSSRASSRDNSRKSRDTKSRNNTNAFGTKRRSTMNSRDAAYDEEEQLRRAIEESKEDSKSATEESGNRRGKRSRSDSEAYVFQISWTLFTHGLLSRQLLTTICVGINKLQSDSVQALRLPLLSRNRVTLSLCQLLTTSPSQRVVLMVVTRRPGELPLETSVRGISRIRRGN
jgi:hypothetical protein